MKKTKKEIPMWAATGHTKPISRRELLASGVMGFSGTVLMPSIFNLIVPSEAKAATQALAPVVTINLEGGAGLLGNYVATDAGGQNLSSYSVLGLGSGSTLPTSELEFGGVPFAGKVNGRLTSQFLQGIRDMDAAGTALPKTAFVAICGGSRDDFAHNELSIDGLVSKAGLVGSLLPGIGTTRSTSGIRQDSALMFPPSPLIVNSTTAITGAISYTAGLNTLMTTDQRIKLANSISKMSELQTRKLASNTNSAALKPLIDAVNVKNASLQSLGSGLVDPRSDATHAAKLDTIWGTSDASKATDQNRVFGMMVYNAINGQAGSIGMSLGGYDYHDKTRTTGDAKDYAAGQLVGQTIKTAEALGSPVFIYVCTDGSTVSTNSATIGTPWVSDGGNIRGVAFMIYYSPAGRVATSGHQIGSYTTGQIALATTPVGNSPKAMGAAALANYLSIHRKLGTFGSITNNFFSSADLAFVTKMGA